MSDFLFDAVWSRSFRPILAMQALAALVGVVFCWRAALAFARPGPWWWFGGFFLLLEGRPLFLLAQEFVLIPRDAVWIRMLDQIVLPSLKVGVLGFAMWAVAREVMWHQQQREILSTNVIELRRIMRPGAASPESGLSPDLSQNSEEFVEWYVTQLEGLLKLWANAAAVGVISIDEDSVIKYANPGAHVLFGYKWGELLGRPLTDLMPPALRPRHRAALRRYLETGQRTVPWKNIEFDALCSDGTTCPITLTFIEHRLVEDRVFTGVIQQGRAA